MTHFSVCNVTWDKCLDDKLFIFSSNLIVWHSSLACTKNATSKQSFDESYLANCWCSVAGVCGNWNVAIFVPPNKAPECVFYICIVKAKCPSSSVVLGWCPVHISNAHPVLILIFSDTPFGVVTRRLPVTHSYILYTFHVVHFWQVLLTIGSGTMKLVTPCLSVNVTTDQLSDCDVEISIWKNPQLKKEKKRLKEPCTSCLLKVVFCVFLLNLDVLHLN